MHSERAFNHLADKISDLAMKITLLVKKCWFRNSSDSEHPTGHLIKEF